MEYIAPDLSIDIMLRQQSSEPNDLSVEILLCSPVIEKTSIEIDTTIIVTSNVTLKTSEPSAVYTPPLLSSQIVLLQSSGVLPSLDVVLCKPSDDISQDVIIDIDSKLIVTSSLSFNVREFVVGIDVDAYADINVHSEIIATYDSNVFRGAQVGVSSDFQSAKIISKDKSDSLKRNDPISQNLSLKKESAKLLTSSKKSDFESNIKLTTGDQFLFEDAKLISSSNTQGFEYHKFLSVKSNLMLEDAKLVGDSNWYSFESMLARQMERKVQGEYSYLDAIMRHNISEYNRLVGYQYQSLSETAKLPSWFTGYLPPPLWQTVILKQQLAPPSLPLDVNLCGPKSYGPRTKLSIAQSVIDVYGYLELTVGERVVHKGVIFVTNSVSLVRSDDGHEIKLLGFTVGIDISSYAWSFSATVPLSELSKVDIANEVRIGVDFTCNGNLWRFILDGCDDSISFGESSLTIQGKSRAMLLADSYAATRSYIYDTTLSARQIADDELNRFGVPSGFTLDWQLAGVNGWNVPANSYSYTDKTPINSLQAIAEAAGGFINAHMSNDVIHVMPTYPVPSWEWAEQTPTVNLPMSLITSRSRGRVNKPAYNGVFMYCSNDNGISALIKRTGTAGGYQPSMITSDLMTDQDAAISRGKAVLSNTGDIGNIVISMPLHYDIGVLLPSTLVGVDDGEQWTGMVKGTTITGSLSSNRALVIEQNIDVERHFDKETV